MRPYASGDLDDVVELCRAEGWRTYADAGRSRAAFSAPGVSAWVADLDGDVVGFCYVQSDTSIQAHLSLLVVADAHRHRGIATAIVTRALNESGATRLDLVTDASSGFYRSLPHRELSGFRVYGQAPGGG